MTDTDTTLAALKARLQVLEAENAALIERAEDALLLGVLSETLGRAGARDATLAGALEQIVLLKSLELAAVCRPEDGRVQIEQGCLAGAENRLRGRGLQLPAQRLQEGPQLLSAEDCQRLGAALRLPLAEALLIPFEAEVYGQGGLLLAARDGEGDGLGAQRELFCQVAELLAMNLSNQLLLQHYRGTIATQSHELARHESLLRNVIEQAHEAFYLHDRNGRFLQVNQRVCEMLGYSKEELLRLQVADIDSAAREAGFRHVMEAFAGQDHQLLRSEHRRKDGTTFPVEINVSKVPFEGQDYFLALARDLTSQVESESLQKQLELLLESVPDVVMMVDPGGGVGYLNPVAKTLFGLRIDPSRPLRLADLMPERNVRLCLSSRIPQAMEQGVWIGESLLLAASGELVPTLQTIVAPRNRFGKVEQIFCIERDLRQLRRLEEQFVHAQKMEAIGTLVGGIAHDFNNLLAGIMGNIFLLQRQIDVEPHKERLARVQQMCQNAAEMIAQMLVFARKDSVKIQPLQLRNFLQEFAKMYRVLIPENIYFELGDVPENLMVQTDVPQFQQLLVNLLTNARDALEGRPQPTIGLTVEAFDADTAFLALHPEILQPELVCISVIDNGSGIPKEVRERIFDPFFTTKKVNKGTGLGLAMVFGAIRRQQGGIDIHSTPGQGTIVRLYLPRLMLASDSAGSVHEDVLQAGQGELILLADDDEFVRNSHQEVLEQLGYRVLVVADGQQAIEAIESIPRIALAILDVVMPNLDGIEVRRQLALSNPGLPVLLLTGYAEKAATHLPEDAEILYKPASMPELSRRLRALLPRS